MNRTSEQWEEWVVQYDVQGARSRTTGKIKWFTDETKNIGETLAREIAKERAANTKTYRNVKLVRRQCTVVDL